MTIFRIHIRPTGTDTSRASAFPYCLKEGVLGLGWQVDAENDSLTWAEYENKCVERFGKKGLRNANYLKENVKINDVIWTRDLNGHYYLGKVLSEWEYLSTRKSKDVDIVNIVRCDLQKVESVDDVPGKVIASFRPARTIQAIRDATTENYTKYLWNKLKKKDVYDINHGDFKNVFSFLSSEETEDVFAIYLQTKGWIIIPNSRKADTMKYEFYLIHKETKNRAVVQVKTGHTSLDSTNWNNWKEEVFLFQANGVYLGKDAESIIKVEPETIKEFMRENKCLLPNNILHWLDMASREAKMQES